MQSVGAVALDILVGKNTISSSIKSSISEATKVINDGTAGWDKKAKAIGGSMQSIGGALLPISTAIGGIGVVSANMAIKFEDAMAKVSTIADTTQVPIKDLEKQILELSNQTGISSSEIANNVYEAISAGQQTGDAVNFVSNATKLAKAGFTDSASALDILTTTLNAYGMEASEVTRVSDVLMQTQNLGKTTVGELAGSMGKIIPTAKAYGVGLEQVATGYAIMTSNGIATAESTTYMNALLNELGQTGSKSSDILKQKTGKSFTELMNSGSSLADVLAIVSDSAKEQGLQFADLFGSSEGAKAGMVLLGESADKFNGQLKNMQGATGTTDVAFQKMQTTSLKFEKAMNSVKNASIELGGVLLDTIMPVIDAFVGGVKILTSVFSALPEPVKQIIVVLGIVLAVLGPLLIIAGQIAMAIGALAPVFTALAGAGGVLAGAIGAISWPIVAVVAGIVGLIAIGWQLYKNWDEVVAFCTTAWTKFKDFIGNALAGIKNFFANNFGIIGQIINTYITYWENVIRVGFETIKLVIDTVIKVIQALFRGDFTAIGEIIRGAVGQFFSIINNAFQNIASSVSGVITRVRDTIVNGFNSAIDYIVKLPSRMYSLGSNIVQGIANGIIGGINFIKNAITTVGNSIFGGIKGFFGIKSPSTKMRDEVGAHLASGIAIGFEGKMQKETGGIIGAMENTFLGNQMSIPVPQLAGAGGANVNAGDINGGGFGGADLSAMIQSLKELVMGSNAGDITIPVYLDGSMLDEVILTAQDRKNLRSGGK